MPGRTIAIGDIHGCAAALQAVLEAIDPQAEDCLVALGDYVDRGPDSRGVIELLMSISERTRLVPLLGNHEEMLLASQSDLETREGWLSFGGLQTLRSYGVISDPGKIPREHLEFFEACREYHETERHFFAHAGYDAELPLDRQSVFARRWVSLRDWAPAPHCSGKTAIVGHTAQRSGEVLDLGYLKCIDTWCYGGGWLTALDVTTGRIWQADATGRMRNGEPAQDAP